MQSPEFAPHRHGRAVHVTSVVALALLALAASAMPSLADKGGRGHGRGPKGGHPAHAPRSAYAVRSARIEAGRAFGRDEAVILRRWFSDRENLRGLPPGLAKRERLPPGLERQLVRNGTLPPGLQSKLEPLPTACERNLRQLPDGYRRSIIGRDVILVDDRTNAILDVLRDVLPAITGR